MRISNCLLLAILLVPTGAWAEDFKKKVPAQFCAPAEANLSRIHSCEDNDLYLEKGEECLTRLDSESKAITGAVIGAFSANNEQKQAGKMASAKQDLVASSAGLAYLIGTTELALAQIAEYKDGLIYPEDWYEEDANEGDVAAYVKSVECYGLNHENLESLEQDFQRRLGELKKAKQVADSFAATTQERRGKLDAGPIMQNKKLGGVGQGSAGAAAVEQGGKPSDITGTKEDKAKRVLVK